MADTRQLRNLRKDITKASAHLAHWRRDGHYDEIMFWLTRRNSLVKQLGALTNEQPKESPAQ